MTSNPRIWTAYGAVSEVLTEKGNPRIHRIFSNENVMKLYTLPYVTLTVAEDEDGEYLGWLARAIGTEELSDQISMVTYDKFFDINFPAGYEQEEKNNRGVAVRLSVTLKDEG